MTLIFQFWFSSKQTAVCLRIHHPWIVRLIILPVMLHLPTVYHLRSLLLQHLKKRLTSPFQWFSSQQATQSNNFHHIVCAPVNLTKKRRATRIFWNLHTYLLLLRNPNMLLLLKERRIRWWALKKILHQIIEFHSKFPFYTLKCIQAKSTYKNRSWTHFSVLRFEVMVVSHRV